MFNLKSISARTAVRIIFISTLLLVGASVWITQAVVSLSRNSILTRGIALAKSGAAVYGTVLQRALETGALKWDDLAAPKYTEITFDVPVAEPRYHSTFDKFTDEAGIQFIEDSMTASDPTVLYAVGNDLTGYIPTTLSAFSHAPTGVAATDAVNARSKRRFTTPMHKAAAEWTGDEPLIQEYHRDTGHVAWDVAQPIWLRNPVDSKVLHWGSFRVGLRQERIAEVRNLIILRLGLVFLAFELVLVVFMYVAVRRQLYPLKRLAYHAEAVSLDETNEPISARAGDAAEILTIAEAMRRLQKALSAAMARIPSDSGEVRGHPTQVTEVPR